METQTVISNAKGVQDINTIIIDMFKTSRIYFDKVINGNDTLLAFTQKLICELKIYKVVGLLDCVNLENNFFANKDILKQSCITHHLSTLTMFEHFNNPELLLQYLKHYVWYLQNLPHKTLLIQHKIEVCLIYIKELHTIIKP